MPKTTVKGHCFVCGRDIEKTSDIGKVNNIVHAMWTEHNKECKPKSNEYTEKKK